MKINLLALIIILLSPSNLLAQTQAEHLANQQLLIDFVYDLIKYGVAMLCLLSGSRFGQEQLKL